MEEKKVWRAKGERGRSEKTVADIVEIIVTDATGQIQVIRCFCLFLQQLTR